MQPSLLLLACTANSTAQCHNSINVLVNNYRDILLFGHPLLPLPPQIVKLNYQLVEVEIHLAWSLLLQALQTDNQTMNEWTNR